VAEERPARVDTAAAYETERQARGGTGAAGEVAYTGVAADAGTGVAADAYTGVAADAGTGVAAVAYTGEAADAGTGVAADAYMGVAADAGTGVAADASSIVCVLPEAT